MTQNPETPPRNQPKAQGLLIVLTLILASVCLRPAFDAYSPIPRTRVASQFDEPLSGMYRLYWWDLSSPHGPGLDPWGSPWIYKHRAMKLGSESVQVLVLKYSRGPNRRDDACHEDDIVAWIENQYIHEGAAEWAYIWLPGLCLSAAMLVFCLRFAVFLLTARRSRRSREILMALGLAIPPVAVIMPWVVFSCLFEGPGALFKYLWHESILAHMGVHPIVAAAVCLTFLVWVLILLHRLAPYGSTAPTKRAEAWALAAAMAVVVLVS